MYTKKYEKKMNTNCKIFEIWTQYVSLYNKIVFYNSTVKYALFNKRLVKKGMVALNTIVWVRDTYGAWYYPFYPAEPYRNTFTVSHVYCKSRSLKPIYIFRWHNKSIKKTLNAFTHNSTNGRHTYILHNIFILKHIQKGQIRSRLHFICTAIY